MRDVWNSADGAEYGDTYGHAAQNLGPWGWATPLTGVDGHGLDWIEWQDWRNAADDERQRSEEVHDRRRLQ